MREERSAQSRLDDILGSETRNAVAKKVIKLKSFAPSIDLEPLKDENLKSAPDGLGTIGVLPPIQFGRKKIEEEIKSKGGWGSWPSSAIHLLDVRLKRVNHNPDVLDRIYQRMISERQQIASPFSL